MGEPAEALSAGSNGQMGDPVVTHGWFVCPTVSMVTTSHAPGLEKTLLLHMAIRPSSRSSG